MSDICYHEPMKFLWSVALTACIFSVFSAIAADIWLSQRISLFGEFAGLQYSLNPGIAFGIRLPVGVQEVLIGMALLAVGYLAYQSRKPGLHLQQMAYGMILGGGVANIIDRLPDGFVTDYFQIGSFPIFNVADSFVTVGVGLLLVEALFSKRGKG